MKTKIIFSLISVIFCLVVSTQPLTAAGGLTVYSGKIETSVQLGSNNVYTMEIANTSDEPMYIGVEVRGYGMSPTQDFIALEPKDDASPYTASSYLSVSPPTFHLEPGKSQVVSISANIPAGIDDGGRYAIVYIHTAATGSGVGVISAVAARVLLTVSGSKLDTTSQIANADLVKSTAQQPAGISFTVGNNGNYHFKPQLQATIRNGTNVVATTALVVPGWPIIPGYSRQFKLDLIGTTPILPGTYQVEIEVKDESGALVTKGTFPLSVTENQTLLPPATTTPQTSTIPPSTSTLPSATTITLSPSTSAGGQPSRAFPTLLAGIAVGAILILIAMVAMGRKRK
ncbi:MAG: hypothetical protein TUN42_05620 [Dehalogenimonas sp.]